MTILLTILIAGLGFSFVFLNWKAQDKEIRLSNWVGWSLALSSVALLILSEGIEFGITYGLFGIALIPLSLVLVNTEIRNKHRQNLNSANKRQNVNLSAIKKSLFKNVSHFIMVVPVSFVFSLLALLLTSGLSGLPEINRLAVIILGLPLLWALIAYLYLYSQRKKMFGSALALSTLFLTGITFA